MLTEDREIFRDLLKPNEKIIWSGKPETGKILSVGDKYMIPLTIFFVVLLIFVMNQFVYNDMAKTGLKPEEYAHYFIINIPILLFLFYCTIGRFF